MMKQIKASLESQLGKAPCEVEDTEEMFWLRESDDYQSKVNLGNALSAQYRFREAAEAYHSARRIRQDDPMLYIRLGGAYLSVFEFQLAYDAYQAALRWGGLKNQLPIRLEYGITCGEIIRLRQRA